MSSTICPVCNKTPSKQTILRKQITTLQNRVYSTRLKARQAITGDLQLNICTRCGFAYNSSFDETLLSYDTNYDNSVSSDVMIEYYKNIAIYLYNKYSVRDGLVIDIGCGQGTFLKIMAQLFPTMRGLGIDPSYRFSDTENILGNLQFTQDKFSIKQITERPALIICRHVLEHIPEPIVFLKAIYSAIKFFPEVPFFVEIPDLRWIIKNRAFWDFCYEHCNYFTNESISYALTLSGFQPQLIQSSFGHQYLWIEATNPKDIDQDSYLPSKKADISTLIMTLDEFTQVEGKQMAIIRQNLLTLKQSGKTIALWGMATKGILFTHLIDPDQTLIDFCIDMNINKQGQFVPVTGHEIQSPQKLMALTSLKSLVIIVMNLNYIDEIKLYVHQNLGVGARFIDAYGESL